MRVRRPSRCRLTASTTVAVATRLSLSTVSHALVRVSMRTDDVVRTVSILGAGRVGTAIARQALKAGYEVLIASSRPPTEIEMLVEVVVPGARAVSAETASRDGDIVIVAIPLPKYRTPPLSTSTAKPSSTL